MRKTHASGKVPATTSTTTVFTSGNSQAVRLPKEFRVNSKTLEISKRGDEIVLRERRPSLAELLSDLPPLTQQEAEELDSAMKAAKSGPSAPEERDFSWMDSRAATQPSRRRK